MDSIFVHSPHHAKPFSIFQAINSPLCQNPWQAIIYGMKNDPKPFADIADRLRWYRTLTGQSQADFSAKIGSKRSVYSPWEAGGHRLSLDGAAKSGG